VKTKGLTFDAVREIGLKLPGTEEGTAWGTPVLRVGGRIFTGIAIHKSAEPNSLVVYVDPATRDEMIAEQPELYYTAAHYENYPCVLARLTKLRRDVLEDLLRMSHRYATERPRTRRGTTRGTPKRRTARRP
jgi:hypothetical protein